MGQQIPECPVSGLRDRGAFCFQGGNVEVAAHSSLNHNLTDSERDAKREMHIIRPPAAAQARS
jgi:hypothetical protein